MHARSAVKNYLVKNRKAAQKQPFLRRILGQINLDQQRN
jgi:hypothetical protein